jgi:hypothetical protein
MTPTYASGEEMNAGDAILYHGQPGTVEFIATREEPASHWYIEQFGVGCMIVAEGFGRVFVTKADEDLVFVERRTGC